MKNFILLFIISISLACKVNSKSKNAEEVVINGQVTQTKDFCGGMRPTDELVNNLRTPKPFANKVIYIKIGDVNTERGPVVQKFTTDENGKFSVKLKVGTTYCFVEDWKGEPFKAPKDTEFTIWDIPCLRKSYGTPDFVLKVEKTNNRLVQINYHHPCFYKPYCGTYSGPLPP